MKMSPKFKYINLFIGVLLINNFQYAQNNYSGTGSVTQGLAITTNSNIFPGCTGARTANIGTITSSDSISWTVPAQTNFLSNNFLPDLYNQCAGITPSNISGVNINNIPVTTIDLDGDTIIGYILGDNYYEMYINGVFVGSDPVPYTPFNSSIVKFKVSRPYTIAFKLVDWEENLGLGSENNNGNLFHAGDGGFIAYFSDGIITDQNWKAQTYYISPIEDLSLVKELPDNTRSTLGASSSPSCNTNCFGVHFEIPSNWMDKNYNDSLWPNAITYSPSTVGVNFPAYNNFSSIWSDSKFIWSSNLVLDNLVLIRRKVEITDHLNKLNENDFKIINPFNDKIKIIAPIKLQNCSGKLLNSSGEKIIEWEKINFDENAICELELLKKINDDHYFLSILYQEKEYVFKLNKSN